MSFSDWIVLAVLLLGVLAGMVKAVRWLGYEDRTAVDKAAENRRIDQIKDASQPLERPHVRAGSAWMGD